MRKSICRMIEEIGQAIHPRVTVIATNSAKVYFHRFFMVQSLTRQDPKMAGITCLFVACKAEECLRSIRQFIWALNAIETDPKTKKQLFPYGVGKKRDRPAEVEDETEAFQKVKQSMLHMERIVMHVLGFEFQVDHPTAYLTRLLRLFDEDGVRKETEHRHLIDPGAAGDAKGVHLRETVLGVNIMQVANAMANDCNSTTLCLQVKTCPPNAPQRSPDPVVVTRHTCRIAHPPDASFGAVWGKHIGGVLHALGVQVSGVPGYEDEQVDPVIPGEVCPGPGFAILECKGQQGRRRRCRPSQLLRCDAQMMCSRWCCGLAHSD